MFSFLFKYKYDFVRLDNNKTIFLDNTRFTKKNNFSCTAYSCN
jgi:hypothetical protein